MGKDIQPLQSVKTSILAELTVKSGLGDIYIKMMSLLCYYVHLIIVYAMGYYAYIWSCEYRIIYATLTFAI